MDVSYFKDREMHEMLHVIERVVWFVYRILGLTGAMNIYYRGVNLASEVVK